MLRRQVQALGADELEVADAHEPEDELQVRLLEIARRIGVQSAAGAGDDHAFAAGQALGAFLGVAEGAAGDGDARSEEHTSELQSLMRISYAVFCLKKKKTANKTQQ